MAHKSKTFPASVLLPGCAGPLNAHSSVNPIMLLAQPGYVNEARSMLICSETNEFSGLR